MTVEEFEKISFRCVSHLAMENEHCLTYVSEDGNLGFCDHTVKRGYDFGRSYRHWRIKGKVYKSKEVFLEALKEYHPALTRERLKELNGHNTKGIQP